MQILLYFGSFNPIHNGHLAIANSAMEVIGCDQLWFVVSPQNPFKKDTGLLPENLRLQMVSESIIYNPHFSICAIEYTLPRPSYTIDTLKLLAKKYPNDTFSLLIGSDNIPGLPNWKDYHILVANFKIYTYPRPGFENNNHIHPNIIPLEMPMLDISSTDIRQRKLEGKSITDLVPEAVVRLWG